MAKKNNNQVSVLSVQAKVAEYWTLAFTVIIIL